MEKNLLEINDLKVSFFTPAGEVKAVDGISYKLKSNEVMGIVGESGSGKSVEAYSIIGLLQKPGKVIGGSINFEGDNLLSYTEEQMRQLRGNKISMIFQNPMTCLNPVYTIGNQLMEALTVHSTPENRISKDEAFERSCEMLKRVGINNEEKRMKQYPHEFSGGMRQRAMIAMALICRPKLLIADEPTTALDVTIQAQILEMMKELQKEENTSIIFITHNLGVVAEICDRVCVMYGGRIVEQGSVNDIFYRPVHPYTQKLLSSMPRLDEEKYERLVPIEGTPIDLLNPPQGCNFGPRCSECMKICTKIKPSFTEMGENHISACFLHQKSNFENGNVKGSENSSVNRVNDKENSNKKSDVNGRGSKVSVKKTGANGTGKKGIGKSGVGKKSNAKSGIGKNGVTKKKTGNSLK